MTDIVERLRIFGGGLCHEAADEIERLQAALEDYACPGLEACPQPKLKDGSCLAAATGGLCGDIAYQALDKPRHE